MQSLPVLRSAGVHVQQQEQYSAGHASSLPKALQPNCTAAVACISACSSELSCYLYTAPEAVCRLLPLESSTQMLHWLPSDVASICQVQA